MMHANEPPTTESNTDSILVVLDTDDPETPLQTVVQDPDAQATEFHLLTVFPTAEYEERRRERKEAGVPGPYNLEHLTQDARRIARRAGREYLDPDEFEPMGAVGRKRDCIRRAVREHDYNKVYVAEQSQTIWQRLLGVADLSTELTPVLSDGIPVVSIDDVGGLATDGYDADASGDSEAEFTTRPHET